MVDSWASGDPVGPTPRAQALAGRLVDAGLAHPRPSGRGSDSWAIVIPVRDQSDDFRATIDALRNEAVEIVVVDDGSQQAVVVDHDHAQLIRHDRSSGPAVARNTGWQNSKAEIVVFIDAGCVPAAGWIDAVLPHFTDPAVAAVAPRVTASAAAGTPPRLREYERLRSPLDRGPVAAGVKPGSAVPFVPAAALAVRREALEEAGGFDPSLRFGEDVDLVWRLHRRGWRVRYEPFAEVTHPARPSWRAWLEQRFRYGSSAAPLAERHGRDVGPLWASPWSMAIWALFIVGRRRESTLLAAATTAALVRRAGRDPRTAVDLGRLALSGHLRAGAELSRAIRTAWLPPAAIAVLLAPPESRRRLAGSLAMLMIGPVVVQWPRLRGEPTDLGPLNWIGLRLADDLAYQAGVWRGALHARSLTALLPRW